MTTSEDPAKDLEQLKAELRCREQEIAMLEEIGTAISSERELSKVLQLVANRAKEILQAETVLIPTLNRELTEYTYSAGSGKNVGEIINETLAIEMGVCGWVWRNKRPWWQGVLAELSEQERTKWEHEAKNLILVPLFGRRHFLGGIAAMDKITGEEFGERDLALLTMFANQVSIAIENAQLFEEVSLAKEKAEQASYAKSMFLSMMSHELLTPLNAIIGFSDVINSYVEREIPLNPKHTKIISKAGNELHRLIQDALEYTSVGSIQRRLAQRKFTIASLLAELKDEFSSVAAANANELEVTGNSTEDMVVGDYSKIHHLIYHLLSNACKFTREGKVRLHIEKRKENGNPWIHILVEDTGIGVPEKSHQEMFKPFVQLDNTLARTYGGAGLGLAIVDEYCRLMEGRLQLQSVEDAGTKIEVDLPVSESKI